MEKHSERCTKKTGCVGVKAIGTLSKNKHFSVEASLSMSVRLSWVWPKQGDFHKEGGRIIHNTGKKIPATIRQDGHVTNY